MKTAIIGAGNVGSQTAMRLVESDLCDVVLLDIIENFAKGKAEDIMDASSIVGHKKTITGTNDYKDLEGSDIVIITAGLPRKPGMTREDLLAKNSAIVKEVISKVKEVLENPILMIVTNPLDLMTYLAYKTSGLDSKRVFGMGGALDSSRMSLATSRVLDKFASEVNSTVIGAHGQNMIPLVKENNEELTEEQSKEIIENTKGRGAEIVSYLGSGSAYFAPSASCYKMVKAIVTDSKETITTCCLLQGEYDLNDVYIGVPAVIGKGGIEEIKELDLAEEEKTALREAAEELKAQYPAL